jgi:hypothetical protein
MKILSINPKQSHIDNSKKECIASMELIAFHDDRFKILAKARWYMGKSSTASVIHCQLWVNSWCMPVEFNDSSCSGHGHAGGGGYCKQSAAFADALRKAGIETDQDISGRGMSVVEEALTAIALNAGFDKTIIARL